MARRGWRIGTAALSAWLAAGIQASSAGAGPRLGVEGGLNLAELTYHADAPLFDPDLKLRPAWWIGLPVELPLRGRWSLSTGPRYVEYGEIWTLTLISPDFTVTGRTHTVLQYVSLPVRAQFRPFAGRGLLLSAGPELGYLVDVKTLQDVTTSGGFVPAPTPPTRATANIFPVTTPRDPYYPWNLVLGAAVGWELPLAGHRALLRARFAQGMTDITRGASVRRTTRGLEIGAGLQW